MTDTLKPPQDWLAGDEPVMIQAEPEATGAIPGESSALGRRTAAGAAPTIPQISQRPVCACNEQLAKLQARVEKLERDAERQRARLKRAAGQLVEAFEDKQQERLK